MSKGRDSGACFGGAVYLRARFGRAVDNTARALLGPLACAYLALGCNGVGRALVGERPVPQPGADICAEPTPACAAEPDAEPPEGVPDMAAPIDLAACGAVRDASCAAEDPRAVGPNAAAPGCAAQGPSAVSTNAVAALERRSCDALRIVDDGRPDLRNVTVPAVRLDAVNISIETVLPLTVELESVSLQHVWFELHGPVTLRITGSQLFSDVRFSATDLASRAVLELDGVRGDALSIGAEGAEFHGDVVVRRSSLRQVSMLANTLEFESVALTNAVLQGDRLDVADATMQRLLVSARRTLLSACTVSSAHFTDCTAFSAIEGTLQKSRIEECSEGVRLYGGSFEEGTLDGQLVLDHAELSKVRLGQFEPTDIAAWDAHLAYVRFCSPAQSVSFGGASSVACARCDAPKHELREVAACVLPDASFEAIGGPADCAALIAPQFCAEPEPKRMRPPY
jgi:uncharacterized protein YjbI with pentapeptide repeats